MRVLAIDPGTTESAWVLYSFEPGQLGKVLAKAKEANDLVSSAIESWGADVVVLEMIQSFGMSVGQETYETCVWIGRFMERASALGFKVERIYRMAVKMHICHNSKANDSNIRTALVDMFGPGERTAVGLKASPGPLYGFAKDTWQALALAITYQGTVGAGGKA